MDRDKIKSKIEEFPQTLKTLLKDTNGNRSTETVKIKKKLYDLLDTREIDKRYFRVNHKLQTVYVVPENYDLIYYNTFSNDGKGEFLICFKDEPKKLFGGCVNIPEAFILKSRKWVKYENLILDSNKILGFC